MLPATTAEMLAIGAAAGTPKLAALACSASKISSDEFLLL